MGMRMVLPRGHDIAPQSTAAGTEYEVIIRTSTLDIGYVIIIIPVMIIGKGDVI